MNNKNRGFTLLELVVVVVILGILAVTAAPRFMNVQRDAHLASADAAFGAFKTAIGMYHAKWVVEGEPTFNQAVDYGESELFPSLEGYPISSGSRTDGTTVTGDACVDIWNSLLSTELEARSQYSTGFILPSDVPIVSWYTSSDECYYYYTPSFSIGERLPILYYSPRTGEMRVTTEQANQAPS